MIATPTRYTRVAIALHWAIAALILFNLAVGFFMEGLPPPLRAVIVPLHISAGVSVLALTAMRVLWRLTHPAPPLDAAMPRIERDAAHVAHFLLYAGMVLMPLTGWGLISAHPPSGSAGAAAEAAAHPAPAGAPPRQGPRVWGVIPLPPISAVARVGATPGGLSAQRELHDTLVGWHAIGGWIMLALVLLHVVGALKHQLVDRQPELQRMLPGRRRQDQAKLRPTNQ